MFKLPTLIGITGLAGSGKDVAANFLASRFGYNTYKLASPIKKGIETMFNLPSTIWEGPEKEEVIESIGASPRKLAQTLGTEWGRRMIDQDVWLSLLEDHWKYLNETNAETFGPLPGLVVSDVRFNNEADRINKWGGMVVRIDRPIYRRQATWQYTHASEQGVDENLVDIIVDNDTDDIVEFLQTFTRRLQNFAERCEGLGVEWYR